MARRLRHPSPALVIALLALFVSLGGTGYAALSVSGKNVKDSSLTGKDIKNSSITGSDVKNRALEPADIKAGELPTGPPGPPGPAGAAGAGLPPLGAVTAVQAFGTGWLNSATSPVGYWKDRSGWVHLRGRLQRPPGNSATAFTLPPGFRPTGKRRFAVHLDSHGAPRPYPAVEILPNGEVRYTAPDQTVSAGFALDGISFRP